MNRLLEIGFQFAGHWLLDAGTLRTELIRHARQKNVLYAFICDGEVKYVGKTVRTLGQRLAGYRTPNGSQTTNINNNARITQALAAGAAVEIFVLPDTGLLRYGQFHLNFAAALEDDIIRVVNPEWNGGRREPVELAEPSEAPEPPSFPASHAAFAFVLQPTYHRTGFFNVGVKAEGHIGADGEKIELFLGDRPEPILGTINRRANTNGTPRIMGGTELRDWFQKIGAPGDSIDVNVFSPTSIRLSPPHGSVSHNGCVR